MLDVQRAKSFGDLHGASDILVLPGVWDAVSARVFAKAGFAALGTTSAGIAWSLGFPQGQDAPWPVFLDACRRIAQTVNIPVTFDVESGFGESADVVCENVREAIEAGACGINLEDGVFNGTFNEPTLAADSIRGIRALCGELNYPLYVNARTDVYLGGEPDESKRLNETIRRGQLYADAGADGFFVPGIFRPEDIKSVVQDVPLPLNVYAIPGLAGAHDLRDLGVRRVSVGCGPMQAILAKTDVIASALRTRGDWSEFTDEWMEYEDAMSLFK